MHGRAERRHNNWCKAIRKRRIDRETQGSSSVEDTFEYLHQYSKGHWACGCGMCKRFNKTNNRGRKRKIHGNYAPSKNWSVTDQKRLEEMKEQNLEFDIEENF